jgi:hypothetical protein
MSDGGKGSSPRPFSVSQETYSSNWDKIFKKEDNMATVAFLKPCGCGRSPTGKCIGWHNLTEEQFKQKLAEHQAKQVDNDQKDK